MVEYRYLKRDLDTVWAITWAFVKAAAMNAVNPTCVSVIITLNHVCDAWYMDMSDPDARVIKVPSFPRNLVAGSIIVGTMNDIAMFLTASPHRLALVYMDYVRSYMPPLQRFWDDETKVRPR